MFLIGVLLLIAGCNPPTIEEPIEGTFINLKKDHAAYMHFMQGYVNFDYKTKNRDDVGSWTNASASPAIVGQVEDMDDMYFCVKQDRWFERIRPIMRKGHDYYVDHSRKL